MCTKRGKCSLGLVTAAVCKLEQAYSRWTLYGGKRGHHWSGRHIRVCPMDVAVKHISLSHSSSPWLNYPGDFVIRLNPRTTLEKVASAPVEPTGRKPCR